MEGIWRDRIEVDMVKTHCVDEILKQKLIGNYVFNSK